MGIDLAPPEAPRVARLCVIAGLGPAGRAVVERLRAWLDHAQPIHRACTRTCVADGGAPDTESLCLQLVELRNLETILVEVANPGSPHGIRGVGEVPIVPPMAAIANAIYHAVGVRLADLPMSPDRVTAALQQAAQQHQEAAG